MSLFACQYVPALLRMITHHVEYIGTVVALALCRHVHKGGSYTVLEGNDELLVVQLDLPCSW